MIWSGWQDFPFEERTADLTLLGVGRAEGIHLSHCIYEMKVAEGENVNDIPGEQPGLRRQEGFLWESALEYVAAGLPMDEALDVAFKRYMVEIRKGVTKQVTVEKDRIHMTPDGFNNTVGELESYKVTRKKLVYTQEEFESKFWTWVVQEQAYCYALGVDTVRWIVLFQAGDYSKGSGSGPKILQSTGTFTVDELKRNWERVLMIRDSIERRIR